MFLLFRGIKTAGNGRSQLCTPHTHSSLESPVLIVLFAFLAHILFELSCSVVGLFKQDQNLIQCCFYPQNTSSAKHFVKQCKKLGSFIWNKATTGKLNSNHWEQVFGDVGSVQRHIIFLITLLFKQSLHSSTQPTISQGRHPSGHSLNWWWNKCPWELLSTFKWTVCIN